jgi:hypothetical protein
MNPLHLVITPGKDFRRAVPVFLEKPQGGGCAPCGIMGFELQLQQSHALL